MSTVRYSDSVEPVYTDGRDIDTSIALLEGEAAGQHVSGAPAKHIEKEAQTWTRLPEPERSDPTYYDRPMLQAPVWGWAIPVYYYVGGLTGASLVIGAACQIRGRKKYGRLIRLCRWIGFVGASISGALLIYDLGKPSRFLNMLRVFRPTSPMNMGAWILSGAGGTSSLALLLDNCEGPLGAIGDAAGYLAGVFGCGLATYTGVLVSNTAVPIWQESRRVLPALFGASALLSAGSLFDFFDQSPAGAALTRTVGNIGRIGEFAAAQAMQRSASRVSRVGRPFHKGLAGVLWHTAEALTVASFVVSVWPRPAKSRRIAAGVLGTLGSLLLRFTVEHAGSVSARDARASFHLQRSNVDKREEYESLPLSQARVA